MPVQAHADCPSDLLDKVLGQLNQLQNDVSSLVSKYNNLVALVNEIKSKYNAHTHNYNPSSTATSEFTSPPRSDAATVTGGTANLVTSADGTTASVSAQTVTKI